VDSVQSLGLRGDDVIGLALPPAFSYGPYNLLMGLGWARPSSWSEWRHSP
jgi:hypothetical protein